MNQKLIQRDAIHVGMMVTIGMTAWAVIFFLLSETSLGGLAADRYAMEHHSEQGWRYYRARKYESAISAFERAIELEPDDADSHMGIGYSLAALKEDRAAIAKYSKALELGGDERTLYVSRAHSYNSLKQHELALADLDRALGLEKFDPQLHILHGYTNTLMKNYPHAISDYKYAIVLDPDNGEAQNDLAWIYATATDKRYHNGRLAVQHAKRACEISRYKDISHIDTLAASYARNGEFDKAIKWEQKAIDMLVSNKDMQTSLAKRLELYRKNKAYVE
ncbi:MAG: tetratricopeptide repeat protein [Gammaproteobacteria bacterium]|nr:tetratricopeptide repeat protein [Gammaproteobacteria bacterium]MDH5653157.1 tetratricopeptide repeat protein [Gammaproteobacteria bacterium]